ncbi:MAG TPA: nitroreductase family protein [Burkholderiaceae bacterium]|jgi:nitroreductase
MDLKQAILGRRAIREYANTEVDEATIQSLIEDAVHAPSAVNRQPWAFTVVRDKSVMSRLSDKAKAYMLASTAPESHDEHFRVHLANPDFDIFYHAPVLVVISAARQDRWNAEDCALAAENLMLSAYAAGLGTCWIGLAQGFLNTPEGKAMLGIDEASVPVAPIIVGRPKNVPPAVLRNVPAVRWI